MKRSGKAGIRHIEHLDARRMLSADDGSDVDPIDTTETIDPMIYTCYMEPIDAVNIDATEDVGSTDVGEGEWLENTSDVLVDGEVETTEAVDLSSEFHPNIYHMLNPDASEVERSLTPSSEEAPGPNVFHALNDSVEVTDAEVASATDATPVEAAEQLALAPAGAVTVFSDERIRNSFDLIASSDPLN